MRQKQQEKWKNEFVLHHLVIHCFWLITKLQCVNSGYSQKLNLQRKQTVLTRFQRSKLQGHLTALTKDDFQSICVPEAYFSAARRISGLHMAAEEAAKRAQGVMHAVSMTRPAISTQLHSCLLYSVFIQCFLFRTISLYAETVRNVTTTPDERHPHP
jgi:hypothetical protein